jgi:hypothetical protein
LTLPEALAMQGIAHILSEREESGEKPQFFAYEVIVLTGLPKGGAMTRTLTRFEEEFRILRKSQEESKRAAATHRGVPRRLWTPTVFGKEEVFSQFQLPKSKRTRGK